MTNETAFLVLMLFATALSVFVYIFDPCPMCDHHLTPLMTGAKVCRHCGFWMDSYGEWHTK